VRLARTCSTLTAGSADVARITPKPRIRRLEVGVSAAVSGEPRPYGRQPVALRDLAESIQYQLERELRGRWTRPTCSSKPIGCALVMSATAGPTTPMPTFGSREPFMAKIRGVVQTGRGDDPPERRNALRPFVFAVVDLQARRAAP
jgi:hypothetical protein